MKHLKFGGPIENVINEIEVITGVPVPIDKDEAVRGLVDYILRMAYQERLEPHGLFWDPPTAPLGQPCMVLVGGATHLEILTAAKYEDWVSMETQEKLPLRVLAYIPYEISDETKKRAMAVLSGTEYNPEF